MRPLIRLCCIFLLLFAQQAALTHAVGHARAHLAAAKAERAVVNHGSQSPEIIPLCAFDAAFGQVLGAAPCGGHDWSSGHAANATPRHLGYAAPIQDFLAPLSRGPPASLLS